MDIKLLVKVTSRAWSLKILALMHTGTPGRQAALIAACGAGRTAFAQSLSHLVDLGLVERNPGYGHPLRPEFRLTSLGIAVAKMAARIEGAVIEPAEQILLRRTWTVPVLSVLQTPRYFGEIKRELGVVTDRALSQSLKHLQEQRWIERKVDVDFRPPRPRYLLGTIGAQIGQAVGGAFGEN